MTVGHDTCVRQSTLVPIPYRQIIIFIGSLSVVGSYRPCSHERRELRKEQIDPPLPPLVINIKIINKENYHIVQYIFIILFDTIKCVYELCLSP
jgi:hypothetical protein